MSDATTDGYVYEGPTRYEEIPAEHPTFDGFAKLPLAKMSRVDAITAHVNEHLERYLKQAAWVHASSVARDYATCDALTRDTLVTWKRDVTANLFHIAKTEHNRRPLPSSPIA